MIYKIIALYPTVLLLQSILGYKFLELKSRANL